MLCSFVVREMLQTYRTQHHSPSLALSVFPVQYLSCSALSSFLFWEKFWQMKGLCILSKAFENQGILY